jgi:hypothetical protein
LLAFVVSASIAQAQITPPSSQCQAAYGLLGPGIAKSQIAIVHAGGNVEIATSMGSYNPVPGTFWFTLRFDPAAGTYVQTFVSSIFASHQIVRTLAADVLGNSDEEVIVGLDSGQILVADGATHATLSSFTLPAGTLTALTTADLDGNGKAELLAVVNNRLYAYSAAGTQLWSVTGPSGIDVVAAQMDGDTGLEVATASGHVVDVRTRSIQWFVPAGFGIRLAANDFDGDGRAELIAARDNSAVLAFDVDTQSQKWSIPWSDLDQIAITDLDGNGAAELLIGDGQWGAIHVYDPATQQQIDQFSNSLAGVTAIAAGDVDGDGANELLFAGGWSSSGENHLYVVNRTRPPTSRARSSGRNSGTSTAMGCPKSWPARSRRTLATPAGAFSCSIRRPCGCGA